MLLASLTASAAVAQPALAIVGTPTDFGNGKVGFTIGIDWNDSSTASGYFALSVSGTNGSTIAQQKALGLDVDTELDVFTFGVLAIDYVKDQDSWWYAEGGRPFRNAVPPFGGVAFGSGQIGSNLFSASFGTDPAAPVSGMTNILNIVLNKSGDNVHGEISGVISRLGQDYNVSFPFGGGDPGGPVLGVSTTALAFGNVRVGTSALLPVTATNTAAGDLTGSYGAASGEFGPQSAAAFGPLAGGESAAPQNYTYTPTTRGADQGVVDVTSNGGNATVDLSGTGVGPVFSDNDADDILDFGGDFGPMNPTKDYVFTIANTTTDGAVAALTDLTITDFSITGPDASWFSLVNDPTGTAIAKDGSLAITVRATYQGPPNMVTRHATLTLNTDEGAALGGDGADFSFALTARPIPEPSAWLLGAGCLVAGLPLLRRRWRRR